MWETSLVNCPVASNTDTPNYSWPCLSAWSSTSDIAFFSSNVRKRIIACIYSVYFAANLRCLSENKSSDLETERKWIPSCATESLAYTLIHLLPGVPFSWWKIQFSHIFQLSMVIVSVPFPEARNRKGTEGGLLLSALCLLLSRSQIEHFKFNI